MCEELRLRDIRFKAQIELPGVHKGRTMSANYRIDLIVADEVLVELKSVERPGRSRSTVAHVPQVDRKACRPAHQLQRLVAPPRNNAARAMTRNPKHLRASVPPWWVSCWGSTNA